MKYELVVIIHPASEGVAPEILNKLKEIVLSGGGTVDGIDEWGKRKLAYMIGKQDFGYYAVMMLTLPAEAVTELERELKMQDEIIRFMIVRQDEVKERKKTKKVKEKKEEE